MKTMTIRCILLNCSWLVLALLTGCDRTVDYIPPAPDAPSEVFQTREVRVNEFLIEAEIGDTLHLDDSSGYAPTLLIIPENLCVYGNGAPCQGELDVQLIQAFTKAEIIFSDIPTTSKRMPLESGGAFYLNITQNGEQLFIRPQALFKIKAPVARTSGDPQKMQFYIWEDTGDQAYDWSLAGPLAAIDEVYYTLEFNDLDRWMNVDFEIETTAVEFSVSLVLDGMATSEAQVFFSPDNFNSVSRAVFDHSSASYQGLVPQGAELQIIAIKKEGDQWYWNKSQVLQNENSMQMTLNPVLYSDLVAGLKNL